jgi:PKD repeat protein
MYFDVSADHAVDVLLFPASTVSIYQSEQAYRTGSVWEAESVFEGFSGTGEWHWTVPSDREATRWFLVIDNLAHPSDAGMGSQGGNQVEASLDAGTISPQVFSLADSIHRVGANDFSVVYGPFSVDEGTFVEIYARTMEGSPDVFVMTESAFSLYSPSDNWSSSSRMVSADMLLVTNERYLPWEVSGTDGEDLYVIVDNRAGPGGGGAGTSPVAVTVTLTLTPVLEPTISSETDLDSVDVGSEISLSALETPNRSNQIPEMGYSWDIDGDGISDSSGLTMIHSWDKPGNYSVRLSVTSVDSRSASSTREIVVIDKTDPVVSAGSGATVVKGFGELLEISGSFSDNWGIDRIDWMIDSNILESNYSVTGTTSSISIAVSNEYLPGDHTVSLKVTDKAGRISLVDVPVVFVDVTSPEILPYENQIEVEVGEPVFFQLSALDNESESISYTWIIEQGTENEIQFNGPQVIHQFDTEGPQNVYCRVENEAGLESFAEILVLVEGDGGRSGLGIFPLFALSIVGVALLAAGGYVAFNIAVRRRISDFAEEEDEEASTPTPPQTPQTQASMWGGQRDSPYQQAPSPVTDSTIDVNLSDLLEDTPAADPLLTSFPDEVITEIHENGEKSIIEAENGSSRVVRKSCSSCSREFELDLPEGIDTAYTICPHCDSEELVSL